MTMSRHGPVRSILCECFPCHQLFFDAHVLAFHGDTEGFRKGDYATVEQHAGDEIIVKDENGQNHVFNPKPRDAFDVGLSRPIGIAVGERLLIRANLKAENLHNGEVVEVSAIKPDGSLVLADKRTIPSQFRQFTYGYATTSHASQGKSIDRGIVLMAGDGIKAANLKQAYVSHSRFEESHIPPSNPFAVRLACALSAKFLRIRRPPR